MNSLLTIIPLLNQTLFDAEIVPLVKKLAVGDWLTKRCTAIALIPPLFSRFKSKDEILQLFLNLCREETPYVRRPAATALKVLFFFTLWLASYFFRILFPSWSVHRSRTKSFQSFKLCRKILKILFASGFLQQLQQ